MDLMQLIKTRQSTRSYDTNRELPLEIIEQCVEAARLAPSACNLQPWHFAVVRGKRAHELAPCVQRLGMNKFASECPAFVVVFSDNSVAGKAVSAAIAEKDLQSIDIGLAVSQLCLRAAELGVASCILGRFSDKKIREALGINKRVRLVVCLGYAAADDALREKKRRPLEEIMTVAE